MLTSFAIAFGLFVIVAGLMVWFVSRQMKKQTRESDGQRAAAFQQGYKDLLPDFHPANVMDYVLAQYGRASAPAALVAHRLGDFTFTKTQMGGEVRVGKGLFEVNLQDPSVLRLRYSDDEREYLWARLLAQGEHIQWTRGPNAGHAERSPER
jgi:hypothetical protein